MATLGMRRFFLCLFARSRHAFVGLLVPLHVGRRVVLQALFLLSLALQRVSRIIKVFPSRSKRAKLEHRRFAYRVGTLFDRYFLNPALSLEAELATPLRQDWNDLLRRIGERRRRDFSALSRYAMTGHHGTVCVAQEADV
jgi:hypothetical protein